MTDSPNCFIGYHVHSDTKPLCKAVYVSESSILVQTNFTPTLFTYRAHLENEDKKLLFRVCCMRYWMASGHSLLQKMTKEWVRTRSYFDFEEYYFWKSSPHTERYINYIFSSLMFSVRRYLLSLIQCLAQHRITSLELQKILQLFQYSHISRVRKLKRSSNICSTSYRNTCTILIEIGE